MATIEPCSMQLLNKASDGASARPSLTVARLSSLSLPPLDSSGGAAGRSSTKTQKIPPLSSIADDVAARHAFPATTVNTRRSEAGVLPKHRLPYVMGQSVHAPTWSAWRRRIHGDDADVLGPSSWLMTRRLEDRPPLADDTSSPAKRHRDPPVKDDPFQLPQLPTKHQPAKQPVVPPIINGLLEPPPEAGVLPPMASKPSFGDHQDPLGLPAMDDFTETFHAATHAGQHFGRGLNPLGDAGESRPKQRRRVTKPRKKWSEQETNQLLLGVQRHGVGKWTHILEDAAFAFNERTAQDLKDRFRTCCPDELRATYTNARSQKHKAPSLPLSLAPDLMVGDDSPARQSTTPPLPPSPPWQPQHSCASSADAIRLLHDQPHPGLATKKSTRAHRRTMASVRGLGIHGPFKQSQRRERVPFTAQDDRDILQGLKDFGPQWTRIVRDPRFGFAAAKRHPTDLRDRVRNKYPDVYAKMDKFASLGAGPTGRGLLLEPVVGTSLFENEKRGGKGAMSSQFAEFGLGLTCPAALDWPPPMAAAGGLASSSLSSSLMKMNVTVNVTSTMTPPLDPPSSSAELWTGSEKRPSGEGLRPRPWELGF